MNKNLEFASLVQDVQACTRCARMSNSERVLGHASGPVDAKMMFIGEAPGRLGADTSHIPFHGDKSGHNFESLLDQVGLNRYDFFVTNAVLCNPKDANGNNATPTSVEIKNCSAFLKRQIEIVDPTIVVTLGATALKACSELSPHDLSLRDTVRTSNAWMERKLAPLYHPGQRAMIHRSFANQLADYQFIAEEFRRLAKRRSRKANARTASDTAALVALIVEETPELSYFALHKLLFLAEANALEQLGKRMTDAYIIRQKDGPYCVDLHLSKLQLAFPRLIVSSRAGRLFLKFPDRDLLSLGTEASAFSTAQRQLVSQVVRKYAGLGDAELKRRVYLSSEMRRVLRKEKSLRLNMFNSPLLSPSKD